MKPNELRTAIVTGAGHPQGIGHAIALGLAKTGFNVAVCDLAENRQHLLALAREIEDIIEESRDKKTMALAKASAKIAHMRKNEDLSSSLDSEVVKNDFWIYMLAALFICNFGSYTKLRKELQKNTDIDEATIHDVILIAGTVHSISDIHKAESGCKKKVLVVDDEVQLTRMSA